MKTLILPSRLMASALSLTLSLGALLGIPSTLKAQIPEPPSKYEIALLEKTLAPAAGIDRAMLEQIAGRAKGNDKLHFLVQLYDIPNDAQRSDLDRRGLSLADYATGTAWIAAIPATRLSSLASFSEVRWVLPWTADHKVHPRVKAHDFGDWTRDHDRPDWVMLLVQLHQDVELERIYKIAEAVGGVAMEPIEGLHGATIWVPEGQVQALAEIEDVLWIEEGPMPLTPTNDGIRSSAHIDPLFSAPYNLDGSGVRLFIFDAGTVRSTHQTFDAGAGSRVTTIDTGFVEDHPTHVAGTAAGDGSGSLGGGLRGRGIATGASLVSAAYQQVGGNFFFWDNAGDLETDYALARQTYLVDLANNSLASNVASNGYSCSLEGNYGVTSNLIDGIVRGNNAAVAGPVIMSWAAGNERGGGLPKARCGANYFTTPPPACAKNPIQVAAIHSDGSSMTDFSSWGPCDDGRLKPIVSAPGCESGIVSGENYIYSSLAGSDNSYGGPTPRWCGTSMAAPAVSGIVSLFIEDWRAKGFAGKNVRPLPALVKAFLIHTTKDLGQPGPDYIYGYGAVDAQAMIDTLRAGSGTLGNSSAPVVWGTSSLANGAVKSYHYSVPAGTGELKASLAWDDAAAGAFSSYAAVNNLTLQLISPSGVVHNAFLLSPLNPYEEAATGLDAINNQEQVLVKNPEAGGWTVRVTGSSIPVGPQTFGLLFSTKSATYDPATCFALTANFETGTNNFTLVGASRVASPAAGHGAFSLKLGGLTSSNHEAYRNFSVPATASRAVLTYYVYDYTTEYASGGYGFDHFTTEIRDSSGQALAVVDSRNDGWKTGVWMRQYEVDLTPYKGTTVRIAFKADNDTFNPTTFWVDDFRFEFCNP